MLKLTAGVVRGMYIMRHILLLGNKDETPVQGLHTYRICPTKYRVTSQPDWLPLGVMINIHYSFIVDLFQSIQMYLAKDTKLWFADRKLNLCWWNLLHQSVIQTLCSPLLLYAVCYVNNDDTIIILHFNLL